MQKNLPKYTPAWVRRVRWWAESSKRDVEYALCNDRRTLLWFANQRAVEYHPTLVRVDQPNRPTHLVLDLDPPDADAFPMAVRAARAVRQALSDAGLSGAIKTSGAKGLHVFVPIDPETTFEDSAAATRAIAARAERTRSGGRHHRVREGRPGREGLRGLDPGRRRHGGRRLQPARAARRSGLLPRLLGRSSTTSLPGTSPSTPRSASWATATPGASRCPTRQRLPADLIEEGHAIPVARVQAMHEGKRRARLRRTSGAREGRGVNPQRDVSGSLAACSVVRRIAAACAVMPSTSAR